MTEAPTLDELVAKVSVMIPELLELNRPIDARTGVVMAAGLPRALELDICATKKVACAAA